MLMTALVAVFVPAVVAAGLAALGGRKWGASAVGLAYLAGHVAVARPAVPPGDVTDRIPWLALAATALALFEAFRPTRPVIRGVGRLALIVVTLWLVLGPVASGERARQLVVSTAVALAAWLNLEALDGKPRGSDVLRGVLITTVGAGLVLLTSGSAVLGFLGLALASALGGAWLAGWGRTPEGFVPVAAAVLTALVLEGLVYAEVPIACALLLAVAPAAIWVPRIGPARRLGPWPLRTLETVAVLIPVGIAVGLAVALSSPSEY